MLNMFDVRRDSYRSVTFCQSISPPLRKENGSAEVLRKLPALNFDIGCRYLSLKFF